MNIKVLGPGCKKCDKTEQIVKEALAEAGVTATVEKITDMMQIAGFGIMSTPAIVIDGDVRLVGKVPTIADVKQMIGA